MTSHMYPENRKTLNWFVGCAHDCIYCKPSFQRQMKRQRKNCEKCYRYEPHAHLERLLKPPPKTEGDEFIFFPSSGDPVFATPKEFCSALKYAEKYSDRTFLIQSKNPACFFDYHFPKNVILGTTIETDRIFWLNNPSQFQHYNQISQAPYPTERLNIMLDVRHNPILITIEPILDFCLLAFVDWLKNIHPNIVYVGYDNHNCKLPEPKLAKTDQLIEELEKFTAVRVKTLRKAWYEP